MQTPKTVAERYWARQRRRVQQNTFPLDWEVWQWMWFLRKNPNNYGNIVCTAYALARSEGG